MSRIENYDKDYALEYKNFGEKVLEENKALLQKSGIYLPIFEAKSKDNEIKYEIKKSKKKKNVSEAKSSPKKNNSVYIPPEILENNSLTKVKLSNGDLNTAYKKSIYTSSLAEQKNSFSDNDKKEFISSIEEIDGNDDTDNLTKFMQSKYNNGLHLNGGGYAYLESSDTSSFNAMTANLVGTYKKDNLTLSYGGSFEYSVKRNYSTDGEAGTMTFDQSGNAILMAKFKTKDITYAGGGIASFYDNDADVYNVYAGVMHNSTGIAANMRRKIQVTRDISGKTIINNQTDVKVNILHPKKAEPMPNVVQELPNPSKVSDVKSFVNKNTQEVNDIVNKNSTGFGMNLKLSTATKADEYGVELTHSSLIKKKNDAAKRMSVTPFLGVYDYHPSTNEGLKVRTGISSDLNYHFGTVNISSKVIVDNKRIMRSEFKPLNTFMTTLDTTVSKNKLSANVSTGYINSNSTDKYLFVVGKIEYKMKNSAISVKAGYQKCDIDDVHDNIFHTGVRYAINF